MDANTDTAMPMAIERTDAKHGVRRAVMTSLIGQILEWYDFFLYGTAAALVFGTVFFPVGKDPLTGTIAAFGGFAVGFVARPIGGVLCGHLGDRYGRKFVMTLTLGAMGFATFAMGLLPGYAEIGIAAPVMLVLLRVVQGLAAGGEWSGSILFISENAPQHKRGRLSAWSPCGATIGFVLSSGAFMLMQQISGDAFANWGWRVPFLFSAVLIGLGLWLRTHMAESREFTEASTAHEVSHRPLVEVLRTCSRQVLMVFGLRLGEGGASWIFFAFSIAYGKFLGLSNAFVLGSLTFSMILMIPVSLLSGYVCDRIGRKPVYLAGALGIVIFAWPFFALLDTRDPVLVVLSLSIANGVVLGMLEGAQPAFISELLPARLRYSGLGIGREVASVLGGGLAPVIATALLAHYRSAVPIAIYLGCLGMVTVITTLLTPETYPAHARARDRGLA
ncbi:MFS transporter [Paraburkholderia unamae]|uniref:MFS transporter n=1 Tax=Paraburkholderia unamae TaxID=219649 RepID=A0ABX5KDV9_9BURK|nr:MFS transporter [Paraburkholderia unamae]RAR50687.1 MFS transporter [Paraburkholderia unamae]CAG9251601.1 MFS transporter [Paraburkholderia unamae]